MSRFPHCRRGEEFIIPGMKMRSRTLLLLTWNHAPFAMYSLSHLWSNHNLIKQSSRMRIVVRWTDLDSNSRATRPRMSGLSLHERLERLSSSQEQERKQS
jgi:hypothetical protein